MQICPSYHETAVRHVQEQVLTLSCSQLGRKCAKMVVCSVKWLQLCRNSSDSQSMDAECSRISKCADSQQ